MAAPAPRKLTFAEYVALDDDLGEKHEFVDGEMIAMAGGTLAHSELVGRVNAHLVFALGAGPCRAFSSEARVRVPSGRAYHPDTSVVCGPVERDPEDRNTLTNPVLIVEVLSTSTEAFDRGDKFLDYQEIPSLRHFVMVSQHAPRIEHYTRQGDGTWRYAVIGAGAHLEVLGVSIAVDDVYRGVELEPRLRRGDG